MTSDAEVALSVVVATTDGWPEVSACIDSLRAEVEGTGAELVIVDGSGHAPPSSEALPAGTRWIATDERDVFRLFLRGFREARGAIVATTEDHCTVRPGWCEAIVRAHREHPRAAAIGGAIENGSTRELLDWASFFITQGPHLSPLGRREVPMTTNEACLSQKRWAVERMSDHGGLGTMMILHLRALHEAGATLRVDDRFAVDHFQSFGFRATTVIHFHDGRVISGFRRRSMDRGDWIRLALGGVLPFVRTARIFRTCWAKGRLRRELVLSTPWALWLEVVKGAGHVLGYATGVGDSPRHLR